MDARRQGDYHSLHRRQGDKETRRLEDREGSLRLSGLERAHVPREKGSLTAREEKDGERGMGNGEWGTGHGAWSMGHGEWGNNAKDATERGEERWGR